MAEEKAREMHPSLANSLWNALNSGEPHVGASLLRSQLHHNTLPNDKLSKKLFDLMKTGPKCQGYRYAFRDPNRLELASQYVSLMLCKRATLNTESVADFGPSSWEDVEHCLSLPINETKKLMIIDLKKGSQSTLRHFGQSLQVAACGVECISKLLKYELHDAMKEKEQAAVTNVKGLYVTKPTVHAALQRNVREALKSAVRWAAKCWVLHGQLVIGDSNEVAVPESADEEWCAMEAKRCLDSLGHIVAYLSWLYCAEEFVDMKDNGCSFLIRDVLLFELEKGAQPESGSTGKKKSARCETLLQFSEQLKIWFILSLDRDFAGPLKSNLSKMLHLSKEMEVHLL